MRRLAAAVAATGCLLAAAGCSGASGGTLPSPKVTPLTTGLPPVSPNPVSPVQVAPQSTYATSATTAAAVGGTATPTPTTYPNWCFPDGYYDRYYGNGLGVPAFTVTPGIGTAAVSWWSTGDPAITAYKVAAVPSWVVAGTQPPLSWVTVAPTLTCEPVQTVLTGLQRSRSYQIWLDVVLRTNQPGTGRDIMAARSLVFRVR